MEEETQNAQKEEKAEQEATSEKSEDSVKTENKGDSSKKEPNLIEQAKIENDRKAELLKEELALQDRKEKLYAEQMVGGKAGMSRTERPKVLSDVEYAEALERGEVDPLKEDGYMLN